MDARADTVPRSWIAGAAASCAVALYGIGAIAVVLVEDGLERAKAWQALIVVAAVAMYGAMAVFGALVAVRRRERAAGGRWYALLTLVNSAAGLVAGASLFWIASEVSWNPLKWLDVERWWLIVAMLSPLPLAAVTLLTFVLGRARDPGGPPHHG